MSNIKLKDVIHFYIGCEVDIDEGKERGILMGGDLVPNSINQIYYNIQTPEIRDDSEISIPYNDNPDFGSLRVRPLLRKISSMSQEEAKELNKLYWGYDWTYCASGDNGSVFYTPVKTTVTIMDALRIINGEDSSLGDFMTVVRCIPFLLKQQFDLFGLIESGQAIDKTTI